MRTLSLTSRLLVILAFSLPALAAVPTTDRPGQERLNAADVAADIALAKETYERLHPGYTRYARAEDLAASWQSIVDDARSDAGLTLGQLYLRVNQTLTLIRCDHTKAELPPALSDERDERPLYFPARIELVERRGFVRVAAADTGLQMRDEIVSIDGRRFEDLLDQVAPFVPYDGNTVWSRESGLTESLEFKGGAMDHFGALLFEVQETATVVIKRYSSAQTAPETLTLTVDRVTHPQWLALKSEARATLVDAPVEPVSNFSDGVFFSLIDTHTAYLRVDTFVNYRKPVDPETLYAPVFDKLKDSGARTLILDLRQNGGGSNDAQRGLMAHLIEKKTPVFNDMRVNTLDLDGLREHLWTWDKRALKPNRLGFRKNEDGTYSLRKFVGDDLKAVKPLAPRFTGRILALTSNGNSSAVTNLLSVLKNQADVTLVGEKTGGSSEGPTAGILFTLTLPNSGIKTRVPFFRHYNNVSTFAEGLGLLPDVQASQTVDDYLAGKDSALLAAIDLARTGLDDSATAPNER